MGAATVLSRKRKNNNLITKNRKGMKKKITVDATVLKIAIEILQEEEKVKGNEITKNLKKTPSWLTHLKSDNSQKTNEATINDFKKHYPEPYAKAEKIEEGYQKLFKKIPQKITGEFADFLKELIIDTFKNKRIGIKKIGVQHNGKHKFEKMTDYYSRMGLSPTYLQSLPDSQGIQKGTFIEMFRKHRYLRNSINDFLASNSHLLDETKTLSDQIKEIHKAVTEVNLLDIIAELANLKKQIQKTSSKGAEIVQQRINELVGEIHKKEK